MIFISLIDSYSDEEFVNIVNNSFSMREISKKIGYTSCSGDSYKMIYKRIDNLKLSCEHFKRIAMKSTPRTDEEVFCENSVVDQTTLRKRFSKIDDIEYKCSICGQEPVWNDIELTLTLDHINGNNHDNRIENLRWVCPNCDRQLPTFAGKNLKKLKKHFYCADCGKEISKGSVRCKPCSVNHIHSILNDNELNRSQLKTLIRKYTFTKIGEMYDVTDNAVRKWCDKYNLPRKSREIKRFTDEEWDKI